MQSKWDFWIALAVAGVAGWSLSKSVLNSICTDLITFFGIQAAVILPAMIFTAGILRPEGLTLPEAKRYGQALREQMIFWTVLLAFDLVTVALLILGKATDWMGSAHWPLSVYGTRVPAAPTLVWLAVLFGTWALLRMIPFVKGVLSLQKLNSDLTEKAIVARSTTGAAVPSSRAEAEPFRPPEGFGRIVSRH